MHLFYLTTCDYVNVNLTLPVVISQKTSMLSSPIDNVYTPLTVLPSHTNV